MLGDTANLVMAEEFINNPHAFSNSALVGLVEGLAQAVIDARTTNNILDMELKSSKDMIIKLREELEKLRSQNSESEVEIIKPNPLSLEKQQQLLDDLDYFRHKLEQAIGVKDI